MFSHVHEMGIIKTGMQITPFVVCYLCSYRNEVDDVVLVWVMEDVLCVTSPSLYERARQHGFSELIDARISGNRPPIPSSNCHWIELQKRAIAILSDDAMRLQ